MFQWGNTNFKLGTWFVRDVVLSHSLRRMETSCLYGGFLTLQVFKDKCIGAYPCLQQ